MFGTSFERPGTWAIIAIAALVLFGYKRLPEVTRSVGKSLRIFKTEMKGMNSDDEARETADGTKTTPAPTPSPVTPPVNPPSNAVTAAPTAPAVPPTPVEVPAAEDPRQQAAPQQTPPPA
jgi:sec-independent protein translocase protein TatA